MASQLKQSTVKQAAQLQDIVNRLVMPKRLKENPLVESECKFLITSMMKHLKLKKKPMVEVESPITICGDTHGQYRDVLRMLDACKWPPEYKYLFLGDYVDRGRRSVEVVCLMFALKLTFPKQFYILRGNHESKDINKNYGFYEEVTNRFSEELYHDFNEVFTWMPVVALVDDCVLCMHGGIPRPKLKSLDDLKNLPIPLESPRDNDVVADLLWSDPSDDIEGWEKNGRGLGHKFGEAALNKFMDTHGLAMVVRAHQVCESGYKFHGKDKRCVTIFSAPNYGGEFGNNAACLRIGYAGAGSTEIFVLKPFEGKSSRKN